jgi:hypothetical protein
MRWRVVIELTEGDGTVHAREVATNNDDSAGSAIKPLGLTLADAKALLAAIQRHLVEAEVADYCRERRCCPRCQKQRPMKDVRTRRLNSLFGTVEVRAPRFKPCRCSVTSRRTLTPVAEFMADRCTAEYERILAKLGAWMPYRRARGLLAEFFPLGDDVPEVETIRQRTLHVGARLEREALLAAKCSVPVPPAEAMTVSIDGGHVRSAHGYQGRTFEVFVAHVGNDNGQQIVFSSVPAEADKQRHQLSGVLQSLGMTPQTSVTVLSDGAVGPRALGEAASTGPVRHVLDWFHLAMRIQHVAQCVKGWPDATADERQKGADLADIVEHIRWRLWHGQMRRALDLIGETLLPLNAMAEMNSTTARAACKVVQALVALETYVAGLSDLIIDYAAARRCGEPFSTSPTEGAVQWLLHRRMASQQQMRWSPRGAHLMLKVRTSVVNGGFDHDHAAAERWARRPFRKAA